MLADLVKTKDNILQAKENLQQEIDNLNIINSELTASLNAISTETKDILAKLSTITDFPQPDNPVINTFFF